MLVEKYAELVVTMPEKPLNNRLNYTLLQMILFIHTLLTRKERCPDVKGHSGNNQNVQDCGKRSNDLLVHQEKKNNDWTRLP